MFDPNRPVTVAYQSLGSVPDRWDAGEERRMQRARFLAGWVLLVVAMVALAACGSTTDDGGGGGGHAARGGAAGGLPQLTPKDSYTVCFPQTEENNPWRAAPKGSNKEE